MTTSSRTRAYPQGGTSFAGDELESAGGSPAGAGDLPVNVNRTPADVGTSAKYARADHKHDVDVAAPVDVGQANAEGTSSSLARADHVHDHGDQPLGDGNDHAVATNTINGFMSASDKGKLDSLVGVEDEGVALPGVYTRFNFTGNGISALNAGGGEATISVPFVSNGILISDEGVNLGGFDRINTVGPGFDATDAGGGQTDFTISTAAPVSVAQANAEGTADDLARADHVHDHGNQPLGDGLDHALATPNPGGVAGFMSPDDKKLLDDLGEAGASPAILTFGQETLPASTSPGGARFLLSPGFDRNIAQLLDQTSIWPTGRSTGSSQASPRAGVLKNFYVLHNTPATGGGPTKTMTYEVWVRKTALDPGVFTGISVTVSNKEYGTPIPGPDFVPASDTTNSYNVDAGDLMEVRGYANSPGGNLNLHVVATIEHAARYP